MESILLSTELPGDAHIVLSKYPEVNSAYLESELSMFHRYAKMSLTSLTQVVTHARALKKEVRDLFPSVIALIRLLLVCPASSAEAERSFSSLRRLKTWLRSTMTQKRFNTVAVCHIHQDLLNRINMDAIMHDFVSRSEIRKNNFWHYDLLLCLQFQSALLHVHCNLSTYFCQSLQVLFFVDCRY